MTAGSLARLQKLPGGRYGHVCIDAFPYMVVARVRGVVYEFKIAATTYLAQMLQECPSGSSRHENGKTMLGVSDCGGDRVATNAT